MAIIQPAEHIYIYVDYTGEKIIINPQRACAARVTVLGLSFLPSVRPSVCPVPLILPLRATRRPKSDTNGFSTTLS